jgi:hypothetical protein
VSPAMIVACLALTVALGGTGFAAVSAALPKNSVGTLQLKNNAVTTAKMRNNAVTTAKMRNNAVTSAKVRNFSLTRADFAPGTLVPGAQGPQGPPGSAGPQGQKGDKGDKGDKGGVGDVIEHTASVSVPGGVEGDGTFESRSIQVNCASDEKGVTGGTNWDGEGDSLELVTVLSTPVFDSGNKKIVGWRGRGGNDTSVAKTFQVVVECVKA